MNHHELDQDLAVIRHVIALDEKNMTTAPPIRKPPTIPAPAARPPVAGAAPRVAKTFTVAPWTGAGEGKKGMIYAPNGFGKTTLASMAPNPIFIGFDDGGREIRNPITGQPLNAINGVGTFQELRDVVHQVDLFPTGSSLVLDTITKAEPLAEQHLFETVKHESGHTVKSIEDYGWGKGYKHLTDVMRLLLTDFDTLIRRGVNVILLAQQGQATVANLEGTDYIQDGPLLCGQPKAGGNVRSEVCSWCDFIFRIGYPEVSVIKANPKASKGRASGSTERQIFTEPEVHFVAKNRMNGTLPPIVSFAERKTNDIWKYIFGA